jgi:hypothetical protein
VATVPAPSYRTGVQSRGDLAGMARRAGGAPCLLCLPLMTGRKFGLGAWGMKGTAGRCSSLPA